MVECPLYIVVRRMPLFDFGSDFTHHEVYRLRSTGFPLIMIGLIPLRWNVLSKLFSSRELRILDAPTADNDVVLASLGGKPELPEDRKERGSESNSPASAQEDKWSAAERGTSREAVPQRGGQFKVE